VGRAASRGGVRPVGESSRASVPCAATKASTGAPRLARRRAIHLHVPAHVPGLHEVRQLGRPAGAEIVGRVAALELPEAVERQHVACLGRLGRARLRQLQRALLALAGPHQRVPARDGGARGLQRRAVAVHRDELGPAASSCASRSAASVRVSVRPSSRSSRAACTSGSATAAAASATRAARGPTGAASSRRQRLHRADREEGHGRHEVAHVAAVVEQEEQRRAAAAAARSASAAAPAQRARAGEQADEAQRDEHRVVAEPAPATGPASAPESASDRRPARRSPRRRPRRAGPRSLPVPCRRDTRAGTGSPRSARRAVPRRRRPARRAARAATAAPPAPAGRRPARPRDAWRLRGPRTRRPARRRAAAACAAASGWPPASRR
jgi:hypothetical protein